MNIEIYTAVLGDYDSLSLLPDVTATGICFTDQKYAENSSWDFIQVKEKFRYFDERVRLSRKIKLCPHIYFPTADYWIWSDAAFCWSEPPKNLIKFLDNNEIATFKYPNIWGERNCIYDEAKACISRKKDNPRIINKQMNKYKTNGYKANLGLVETTILTAKIPLRFVNLMKNGGRKFQMEVEGTNYVLIMSHGC